MILNLLVYAAVCFAAAFVAGAVAVWRYSDLMAEQERARLSDSPIALEISQE